MTTPETLLLGLYFSILACLSVYGLHRCYLVYLYTKYRPRETAVEDGHSSSGQDAGCLPFVTLQLPIYNERYVVDRLVDAVSGLDYPRDRFEVQLLDDSTDDTVHVATRAVARARSRGVDIHHVRRTDRSGFKAGALAAGLERARGDLIAIFDADFVPPTDFLRRAVVPFGDPGVGVVQARWGHLNATYSWLTRLQAMLLDAHFVLEHGARYRGGLFFNFNGTAGVWRRQAIVEAGGWQHDTITEDLDLSYRAQLVGWRFVFLQDLVAPAEVPVEMNGFKTQQHRWARGSVQTALKLFPRLWRAPIPVRTKMEALFHLGANFNYPLLLLLAAAVVPTMLVRASSGAGVMLFVDVPLFGAAMLSLVNFYALSQWVLGRGWLRTLLVVPLVLAVGIGLTVNNTRAVLGAFRRTSSRFVRTPKYGVVGRGDEWAGKRYRQRSLAQPWWELALGLYFTAAVGYAAAAGLWSAVPFLVLFQVGFLYTALLSLFQSPPRPRRGDRRSRGRRLPVVIRRGLRPRTPRRRSAGTPNAPRRSGAACCARRVQTGASPPNPPAAPSPGPIARLRASRGAPCCACRGGSPRVGTDPGPEADRAAGID